tara:strand:+ start:93 stop:1898 length:1806 start_codon:yes stop_codon:yes gene_type:complete
MRKLNNNDIEVINTFKNKFSNELRPKLNDNRDQIEEFIQKQKIKIGEIESLIKNINNQFGEENTIAKKYVNFLEYIKALINAKIKKDEDITKLLTKVFNTIGRYIQIIQIAEFTLIENPIDDLISIDNVNTSMNVSDLIEPNQLLSEEEKKLLSNNSKTGKKVVEMKNLTKFINAMIKDCKNTLNNSIKDFMKELEGTQLGTIGEEEQKNIMTNINRQIQIQDIQPLDGGTIVEQKGILEIQKYQEEFNNIKTRYEKELKENIISYKKICSALTDKNNGLVPTVIKSLRTIINKERKIKRTFKINLDSIFPDTEPFAKNKAAFENLEGAINAAKKELLNPSPKKQSQVSDVDGPKGEEILESLQPLRYSFYKILQQIEGVDENMLNTYKNSLLESLQNINYALNDSISRDGITSVNKEYPHNYIAYDFGWKDNHNAEGGYWQNNEITTEGTSPTETISDYINILKNNTITKDNLKMILRGMIELLKFEESSDEKGRAPQGTNYQEFKEKQKGFIPQIPESALTNAPSGGGYKKKSKSKKMTSKKTSMKVAKKTSSKAKENKNKNKKIVKSYSKSKSKKQSGGFIRGGVLFPQDFYDTSTVM